MANHAALIRQQNEGLAVTRRGRRFLEFALPDGKRRFVSTIEPLHVRDSETEIDATWSASVDPAWQWQIAAADYAFHARSVFNSGNLVEWRKDGEWVAFDPQSINWVNQNNSRQQIAIKQVVTGVADDATLRFPAAYGAGRHFEYIAHPSRLMKHIVIDSAASLPAPEAWLTGTLWFEAEFTLANSAGVDLWLDGVRWARANNVRVKTGNRIEFRSITTGEVLWYAAAPVATDANGETAACEYEVRRQGGGYFITVRVPRTWMQAAAYPVVVDPTLDVQPDATAGIDTYVYRNLPTFNYATATEMMLAAAGEYYRQGLIKFDLSDLEGAELTSATLTLYISTTYEWDPQPIHVHRILVANSGWTEAGAKWDYSVGTTRWAGDSGSDGGEDAGCTVSGTDYSSTVMGSRTIPANAAVGSAQAATLDLDELATMVGANYGMVIEPTSYAPFQVASSDHATSGYRPQLVVEYTEASSGTNTPQAVAGAFAPTATLARNTGKPATGTLATAGALARGSGKGLAGSLVQSGGLAKGAGKPLSGTLVGTGALIRGAGKPVVGSFAPDGALGRGTAKPFSGELVESGALSKDTGKPLAGAWTATGTLATLRAVMCALEGVWAGTGSLVREAGKGLTGTWASGGTLARGVGKGLAGAWAAVGTLQKNVGKTVSGAWSGTAGLLRGVGKALSGAWSAVGALSSLSDVVHVFLYGVWMGTGTVARHTYRGVTGSVALAGSVGKGVAKFLSGVWSAIGTFAKMRIPRMVPPLTVDVEASAATVEVDSSTTVVEV